ncbi:MAG: T9SS type A sorting domain-containing protein [Phycisphaerae bacterium]|nr:T9SS type A sorting domain-containing protein [Saprospiraceae bacterium]
MKLKLLFLPLLLLASIRAAAQSISPEVTAAAGDSHQAANGTRLSWTIGECAVETYTSGNTRLTLGFHQMYVQPMSVPTTEASPLAALIRVSPNPTSGILQMENLTCQTLSAVVTDGAGRLVFSVQNVDFQYEFDFSNFSAGNYVLQFFSKNEHHGPEVTLFEKVSLLNFPTTFKIVKQ